MDPLSITTSVITLIGAASNVYNFLQSIRYADRGLQSLVREVNTLNGFLRSIEKALEECRGNPYALTHIDPALWKESKVALSDCQQTLDELGSVFSEPKRPSRSNTLFRKARVAAELRSRAGDIASFREKISMSNMSLQTLLQVINVSLSLRSNESHDNILRDLKELKNALKKSSQAATVSYSTLFLNEQDTRLVHHLKGLIRAAHEFHTSASTTASTVVGGGETQPPPTDFGDDDARSGIQSRMPSMKRKQIETYLSQNERVSRASTSASDGKIDEIVSPGPPKTSEAISETRDVGSNHTFSTIFTSGFSKIAQRALQQLDLQKAEDLLIEALKWYSSSGSDDVHHQRRLQTQLALCHLLQGNRGEAQGLILDLVDSSMQQDTVAHQLLYSLTLLQLHELDFEGARENSKRLWEALQRTPHCTVLDANDAMRLLATSYQESGDALLACAIEAELPDLRLSEPVPKMVDFLVDCEELIVGIFGLQGCSEITNSLSVVRKIHNLPIAKKPSSLQMREQSLVDMCSPVLKDPLGDVEDGLSMKAYPNPDKNQSKAKKRSWSNLRAFFRPRLSWDAGIMDLYPLQTGAQDSTFKLRKRAKTSHVEPITPPEPSSNCNTPGIRNLTEPGRKSSKREFSGMQNSHDSDSSTRTMEWIVGQPDSNPTDTIVEGQDIQEPKPRLQRQFSFAAGLPDHVSLVAAATTPPDCYEMPNNAVFELMGTSIHVEPLTGAHRSKFPTQKLRDRSGPKPKRVYKISRLHQFDNSSYSLPYEDDLNMGTVTSLEMENDIYHLLGYDSPVTHVGAEKSLAKLDRPPSSAGSDLVCHLDVAVGCSSSGSDSDATSDFDRVTPSTRQTSFDSSCIFGGFGGDAYHDGSVDKDSQPQTIAQRAARFETNNESRMWTPSKGTKGNGRSIEPSQSPSPLQTRASSYEATDDIAQPLSLNPQVRARREFGPAIARLCRYKSPRSPAFNRRPPARTTSGLGRLFHTQNREDNFDFGFNNALYFGPDAVTGPFTDSGKTDPHEGQRSHKFAPCAISTSSAGPSDASTSVKAHSRSIGSNEEASADEKRKPSTHTDMRTGYYPLSGDVFWESPLGIPSLYEPKGWGHAISHNILV
ncbi:hypothetical protein F4825DRAFT_143695 [Nemania diffusa]|nr:hypothetical protein F4825DRAFT_143695 [Nemania diffusa]